MVLLHGANGAGKTNLLEALHVGTQGFSPRARNDGQLIRFGTDAGRVALRGTNAATGFETDVVLASREPRRVHLNGERLSSSERLRHELATLVFTPDRLGVVKGPPATRRAYLDRALGRLHPARAGLPLEYSTLVGQRNAALRRLRAGGSTSDALRPWTERLVSIGVDLVEARGETARELAEPFTALAGELGLQDASLEYAGEPPTVAELDARLGADLERGITGAGPHLHDLRLEAGDRDLRSYGSQGEQRIAVLALVLAEAEVLRARTGTTPLVLLDDVLSELDGDRRRALAGIAERAGQAIVTATAAAAFPSDPAQVLTVEPGRVS